EDNVVALVELLLQRIDGDLEFLPHLLGRPAETAEFLVVNQLLDGRIRTADGTFRVLAELQLAEFHLERVEHKQPANQRVLFPEQQLECLDRLDRADDSREDAEHAALGTGRYESRRRRLGLQAPVARSFPRVEDAGLYPEAE